MRKIGILLTLVICTACSGAHDLTACRGSIAAANPGKWTLQTADLAGGSH